MNNIKYMGALVASVVLSGSAFAATIGFGDCSSQGIFKYCKAFNTVDEYNAYVKSLKANQVQLPAQNPFASNPASTTSNTVSAPSTPVSNAPASNPPGQQTPVDQMQIKYYIQARVLSCEQMSQQERFRWMTPPNKDLYAKEGTIVTRMGDPVGQISGGYVQDAWTVSALSSANNNGDNTPPTLQYGGAVEERGIQKDQNGNVVFTGEWYLAKVGFCSTNY